MPQKEGFREATEAWKILKEIYLRPEGIYSNELREITHKLQENIAWQLRQLEKYGTIKLTKVTKQWFSTELNKKVHTTMYFASLPESKREYARKILNQKLGLTL